MNDLVKEWFKKAESDKGTAFREFSAGLNWDAVCFHVQQCVEKYLKGVLQQNEINFPKTHDLAVLMNLIPPKYTELKEMIHEMEWLSAFAVEFRYPGEDAVKEDARYALEIMKQMTEKLRLPIEEEKHEHNAEPPPHPPEITPENP
ncbi:MAG: HEPN domain-containing protein [Desulfococcaceae bacterium]|jgi:HEPN domain-containing protein|nr:HEPN domain-containing protein [Desulfococcaceae bacterium]